MAALYTIGIDLGGTNIKGGVCDEHYQLVVQDSIETQADRGFEHVFARLVGFADMLLDQAKLDRTQVAGIGIGAPGPLSRERGVIFHAPNLPGWHDIPLRDRLGEAAGLSVDLENDANAAAFGEFVAGAGRDAGSIVLLTLGTGIGGGVVLNGNLWRGHFENAGEIGHCIIVPNGRPCPCGQNGCLERYASANAVAERFAEAILAGEPSLLKSRVERGDAVTSVDVLEAANEGDSLAKRIWDETCYYLALACTNLQHAFNPQLVVLAGGLINAGERLLGPTRAHFDAASWRIADDRPQIVFATLGTDAGTIGAAALARACSAHNATGS